MYQSDKPGLRRNAPAQMPARIRPLQKTFYFPSPALRRPEDIAQHKLTLDELDGLIDLIFATASGHPGGALLEGGRRRQSSRDFSAPSARPGRLRHSRLCQNGRQRRAPCAHCGFCPFGHCGRVRAIDSTLKLTPSRWRRHSLSTRPRQTCECVTVSDESNSLALPRHQQALRNDETTTLVNHVRRAGAPRGITLGA